MATDPQDLTAGSSTSATSDNIKPTPDKSDKKQGNGDNTTKLPSSNTGGAAKKVGRFDALGRKSQTKKAKESKAAISTSDSAPDVNAEPSSAKPSGSTDASSSTANIDKVVSASPSGSADATNAAEPRDMDKSVANEPSTDVASAADTSALDKKPKKKSSWRKLYKKLDGLNDLVTREPTPEEKAKKEELKKRAQENVVAVVTKDSKGSGTSPATTEVKKSEAKQSEGQVTSPSAQPAASTISQSSPSTTHTDPAQKPSELTNTKPETSPPSGKAKVKCPLRLAGKECTRGPDCGAEQGVKPVCRQLRKSGKCENKMCEYSHNQDDLAAVLFKTLLHEEGDWPQVDLTCLHFETWHRFETQVEV